MVGQQGEPVPQGWVRLTGAGVGEWGVTLGDARAASAELARFSVRAGLELSPATQALIEQCRAAAFGGKEES